MDSFLKRFVYNPEDFGKGLEGWTPVSVNIIETDSGNLTQCNKLILTNNREFTKGRLKIEIISNVSGETIGTLNIRLGGIM